MLSTSTKKDISISFSQGEYRSLSSPYFQIFGSYKTSFTPQDSTELFVTIDNKTAKNTKDIFNLILENYDSLFGEKENIINKIPKISQQIITAYDNILLGQVEEKVFEEINSYLSGNFLEDKRLLTIYDFLLHELVLILKNLNRPLYDQYLNIKEFVSRFETTEFVQPQVFHSQFLLKPFSPSVKNVNQEIQKIVSKHINTFADFANLENCSYHFKLSLSNGEKKVYTDHIPFSVSPIVIQRSEFDDFYSKTELWNQLIDKMTKNYEWVKEIFKNMNDPLLQGFLKIAEKANHSEKTQKIQMGLIRNDVMHSASKHKWLQVEYNTISISFGYIAEQVQSLQRTIKNSYLKNFYEEYEGLKNSSVGVVVEGLKNAYDLYNKPNSQILVVVSEFEGNSYDQRYPEYLLAKDHGIVCKRRTFEELIEQTEVKEDGTMFVEGDEIAVIYYRTGYSPDHFPNERIWQIREKIELTQAIKCPSVNIILVGFKKLQKTLQEAGQMEQFLSNEQCQAIKENFAQIYDFEDESKHDELLNLAKNDPDHYILKPQREGGDNNIYGNKIYSYLRDLTPSDRKNYILMEKIIPKPAITYMVRNRQLEVAPSISELGIISYFISDSEKILHNKAGGYLVRTKRYFDNEGGVNAGYSVIDGLMVKKQAQQ